MDSEDAAKYLERARDLLDLATKIKSPQHHQLLIDSAEKFLVLAMQVLGREPKR